MADGKPPVYTEQPQAQVSAKTLKNFNCYGQGNFCFLVFIKCLRINSFRCNNMKNQLVRRDRALSTLRLLYVTLIMTDCTVPYCLRTNFFSCKTFQQPTLENLFLLYVWFLRNQAAIEIQAANESQFV